MARQNSPSQAEPPGDEALSPLAPRGLKAVVVIMGVLLIVGFIVLFATIVYRAVNPARDAGAEIRAEENGFAVIEALIGREARVGSIAIEGDRLAVEVEGADGAEIILFDLSRGRELGRIRFRRE